jgi:hypothetical protein
MRRSKASPAKRKSARSAAAKRRRVIAIGLAVAKRRGSKVPSRAARRAA